MLRVGIICSLVVIISLSCRKKELIPGSYIGNEKSMGNGTVYSFVTFDKDGNPLSLGIKMTESALDGLPSSGPGHQHQNSFDLPLPPTIVSKTPFTHAFINWNPEGHEPKAIYAAPHFDFHFYTISSSERLLIPSYAQDSTGFKNKPHADYFPPNYFNPGAIASDAQMGTHWIDANTPELTGVPFTETFVYGSYNGKVNYLEPMMTHSYFKSLNDWSKAIPRPAKVQIHGYYPTLMRVTRASGYYTLSFENFEYRKAS